MTKSDVMSIDWVEIPAGTLVRGTPADQVDPIAEAHADVGVQRAWILKESPRAEVSVAAFAIARTPVTVAQWRQFALDTGADLRASMVLDDHPIDDVTWAEANRFCAWISARLGASVELSSEQQWERAARGDDVREYPWGDHYVTGRGNLADLKLGRTVPVGSFPGGASPFGVLDLVGNVDEWTSTLYAPYPNAPDEVPGGEPWATDPHITRGGGFNHHRDLARCARRHGLYAPFHGAGCRLVRNAT
jgi:formylglycine-generating enzyme required for sulfatase activity